VELPETLVQEEIRALLEQTAGQLAQQGMDVRKLFTPELVRSLRDTSRPEAEKRLRRSLALKALALAEAIELAEEELETKIKELSRSISESGSIDPARLRQAVQEDLMRQKLLDWLESHSTITAKSPEELAGEAEAGEPAAKPAAKTKAAASKKAAAQEPEASA
jgi:trigger factor